MAGHDHDGHGGHGHGAHGHADAGGDKGAAFLGLIGGLVVLGGFLYGMVAFTNARYAHEKPEKPTTEASSAR